MNTTSNHFPLPENATSLNVKQLTELLNNDEFLNHYVINKSYHEYDEIIKYDEETKRLSQLLDEINEVSVSFSNVDTSEISSKIAKIEERNTNLKKQVHYLNRELTTDNISKYLEVYLAKIQKSQIDPLKKKIMEDPYNVETHAVYIEVLTKFNKLKTLFKSLPT